MDLCVYIYIVVKVEFMHHFRKWGKLGITYIAL